MWLALVTGGVAAGGCTFVNTFGDTEPLKADTGTSPTGDTGNQNPDTTPPDTGPTDQGLVVVGGKVAADGGTVEVLDVLDPATGAAMTKRETLQVNAIVYDGNADVWYIFENTSGPNTSPAPGDQIKLHARKFDLGTKKWVELGNAIVPVFYTPETIAVLKQSIAYIGYKDGSALSYQLNVINTSDPTKMTPISGSGSALDTSFVPVGLMGAPASGTSSTGGNILIARSDASSTLTLLPVTIPNNFQAPIFNTAKASFGTAPQSTQGAVAFGSQPISFEGLVALPTVVTGDNATGTLKQFTLASGDPAASDIDFNTNSTTGFFRPIGVSTCKQIAFVSELPSEFIYAIPLNTGSTPKIGASTVGHPARGAFYEPYTDQVFSPFTQGGQGSITALQLTVASDGTPALKPNQDFTPPSDLQPDFVATRTPAKFVCK